jgi:hypothetical protein
MGQYINPPAQVKSGRRLFGDNYALVAGQLQPNERLVAFVDRGMFKQAPVLPDECEFNEFYGQYRQGHVLSCDFYAIPVEVTEPAT